MIMTSACDHSVSKYGIDSDPRVCSAVSLEYGESLVSEGAEWTQSSLGVCGQERAKECRKECEATSEIWSICYVYYSS